MPVQTGQTEIRLLLQEQSGLGFHCLPFGHNISHTPHQKVKCTHVNFWMNIEESWVNTIYRYKRTEKPSEVKRGLSTP